MRLRGISKAPNQSLIISQSMIQIRRTVPRKQLSETSFPKVTTAMGDRSRSSLISCARIVINTGLRIQATLGSLNRIINCLRTPKISPRMSQRLTKSLKMSSLWTLRIRSNQARERMAHVWLPLTTIFPQVAMLTQNSKPKQADWATRRPGKRCNSKLERREDGYIYFVFVDTKF